jgi:hypothetical protein
VKGATVASFCKTIFTGGGRMLGPFFTDSFFSSSGVSGKTNSYDNGNAKFVCHPFDLLDPRAGRRVNRRYDFILELQLVLILDYQA